jgi:hypothetical protein
MSDDSVAQNDFTSAPLARVLAQAERVQELIDRANWARWQQLQTGVTAYGWIADRAMDLLKEEAAQ